MLLGSALVVAACRQVLGIDPPPLRAEADADVDAAAPSDAASADCGSTTSNAVHCGRCGHSCLGDPCADGECEPVTLASDAVGGVDVDDTSVYWSSQTAAAVLKIEKGGSASPPLTLMDRATPAWPRDLKVDGPSLTVVNRLAGDGTASLYRVSKNGGAALPLGGGCVPDGNQGLAYDATHYYFVNPTQGIVARAAKGSGDCSAIATSQQQPTSVVVDDTAVFFTNRPSANTTLGVMTLPKSGGTPSAVAASELSSAYAMAMDGDALYVCAGDGRIVRMNKDGSGVTTLATGMFDATAIVVDDTAVYWAALGDLWAGDKTQPSFRRIAAVQGAVVALATDRERVYWGTATALMRVTK